LAAGSDIVAHSLNYITTEFVDAGALSACLTGPIVDGNEVKDSGTAARVLLMYCPLRDYVVEAFKNSPSKK
jgi:hypothetical protein